MRRNLKECVFGKSDLVRPVGTSDLAGVRREIGKTKNEKKRDTRGASANRNRCAQDITSRPHVPPRQRSQVPTEQGGVHVTRYAFISGLHHGRIVFDFHV